MGFWEAKHGLKSKILIRANLVSIFEGPKTVEREEKGRRRRRRGIGREEEEKRRGREEQKGMDSMIFGMDFYDFWYGFYMESKDLMVLYGILGNFMSSKPRV